MPIFQECAVILDGKKEVYRKGETVTGSLVLAVTEDVIVKGVRVYLYGETLVKWDEFSPGSLGSTKDCIAREKYFGLVDTVIENVTLTVGLLNHRFKFNLPREGLPSSYEGEYGAIRYWVKVEVDRPFPNFKFIWQRGITLLDDINVNDSQYKASVQRQAQKQISKALGLGDAGSLTLTAATDRGAYCAGEKVALKVVVKNESTKGMGKLKAQLEQKVVFTANNETKTRQNVIRVLEGTPVVKGEERVWNNQLLEVDAIPPTTMTGSCHIIAVSYYVKVLVEVPSGHNLETTLPITIGTIPYGHVPAAGGATAAASTEIDASSAITYTKCNPRSFQVYRKSEGTFTNFNYIPMCAYVVNYTFPPHPSPACGTAPPHALPPNALPKASSFPLKLPPSNEDVLKMFNSAVTLDKPYGVLFLRFPDTSVQEFRGTIARERQSLAECEGEIIALAPQVLFHDPNAWPAQTSVAILKFPSVEVAADWFNKTPGVADPKWLGTCDAIVATMKEQFREASRIFTMATGKLNLTTFMGKINKMSSKVSAQELRSFRLLHPHVSVVSSPKFTTLRGSWMGEKNFLTLTQWETMDILFEFKSSMKTGAFKELYDLVHDTADGDGVMFKSEDLSLSIQTTERSESPAAELQSQNTQSQAESQSPGVVNGATGKRRAESTISESPAAEMQSQNTQSQAESQSPGVVNEATGKRQAESTISESPAAEMQSQNTQSQAESQSPGVVNGATGKLQAESTISESPAAEMQSQNTQSQAESQSPGVVNGASIQTTERSESPAAELQSQNTQSQSQSPGDVNEASGKQQAESTRSVSPAVEVQSDDIDNTETQTQSEAPGDGDEAEGEDQDETIDIKSQLADLQLSI